MADAAAKVYEGYPTRDDVLDYLTRYEARYQLPIRRPVKVTSVERGDGHLKVKTDHSAFAAKAVVSATGHLVASLYSRRTPAENFSKVSKYIPHSMFSQMTMLDKL